MNCKTYTGSITRIDYIDLNKVDRITHNWPESNQAISVNLIGGAQWETLDFMQETAHLIPVTSAIPHFEYQYSLNCDVAGVSPENNVLLNSLLTGLKLVKIWDTNKNIWLLGMHNNGGRWSIPRAAIGKTIPDDNQNSLLFVIKSRIPMLNVV